MTKFRNARVLVLNHFAVPRAQAGGTRHVELFSRLEGWDYLIVASNRNPLTGKEQMPEFGFLPVRVMSHDSNGWRRIAGWVSYSIAAFLVGIRQHRIDVVYASSPHLLAALSGWAIAVIRRIPFVLEVRDLWPEVLVDMGQLSGRSPIFRVLRRLEVFLYSRAEVIIIVAEGSRDTIRDFGVCPEKLTYIPNGANPDDFLPTAERNVLRERFGFRRFTAIYAGAHGPANGLHLLLDAAQELREEPIDIVLIGGGVAKVDLVQSAKARSLTNVRFFEPVAKDEIPDLLHAADLGLHVLADAELFRTAVSPNKLFDYMAAGLPALTNCPGLVSDLIVEARCGCAAPPSGLASALRYLVTDVSPAERAAMAENGRVWIGRHQSRSAMSARLQHTLDAIINN